MVTIPPSVACQEDINLNNLHVSTWHTVTTQHTVAKNITVMINNTGFRGQTELKINKACSGFNMGAVSAQTL